MPGNEKAVAGWVTGHLILSVCRTRRQSLCGLIFVNNNLTPSLAVRQENRPMPSRTYHYYQVKYMLSAKSPRLKRFVYWIFPIAWQVLRLEDIGQNEGFANVCKTRCKKMYVWVVGLKCPPQLSWFTVQVEPSFLCSYDHMTKLNLFYWRAELITFFYFLTLGGKPIVENLRTDQSICEDHTIV